ncbi:unnamed protein product [Trichobilharzia regenti]|nr:unnamed protein product [Trichobilharzia regenti]
MTILNYHLLEIPFEHTMQPTCTGTSVIGIRFRDGVVLAADMLVSYGSLARYMDFERMFKVNKNTVMCCSGDVADFQFLKHYVEEQTHLESISPFSLNISSPSPHALHSLITRILYNRRSRLDPLWNTYIVGGLESDGKPFLGYCNMLGVCKSLSRSKPSMPFASLIISRHCSSDLWFEVSLSRE